MNWCISSVAFCQVVESSIQKGLIHPQLVRYGDFVPQYVPWSFNTLLLRVTGDGHESVECSRQHIYIYIYL